MSRPRPLLLLAAALSIAALSASHAQENPAEVQQLVLPGPAAAQAPGPARSIAELNSELRAAQAEDEAFAAAILEAILSIEYTPSPHPPVFVPEPGATRERRPSDEAQPLVIPQPPRAPSQNQAEGASGGPTEPRRSCGTDLISSDPACRLQDRRNSALADDDILTLEDGVYLKN